MTTTLTVVQERFLDAVVAGKLNVVEELLPSVDIDTRDPRYSSDLAALHYACRDGNLKLVRLLIDHKADLNVRNRVGSTPLHLACQNAFYDIAKLLIVQGADINAQDNFGWTPLHKSVEFNRVAITVLLLTYSADTNIKTSPKQWKYGGLTAEELAILENKKEILGVFAARRKRQEVPLEFLPQDVTMELERYNQEEKAPEHAEGIIQWITTPTQSATPSRQSPHSAVSSSSSSSPGFDNVQTVAQQQHNQQDQFILMHTMQKTFIKMLEDQDAKYQGMMRQQEQKFMQMLQEQEKKFCQLILMLRSELTSKMNTNQNTRQ